jgi:hypothetical protein
MDSRDALGTNICISSSYRSRKIFPVTTNINNLQQRTQSTALNSDPRHNLYDHNNKCIDI